MEESSRLDYSKYRLDLANEYLRDSKKDFEEERLKSSLNRSYYAIFDVLRAVTILDNFDSKKHSGIISYFNREYIRTGIFDRNIYQLIDSAFRLRNYADYDDFYLVSKKEVQNQIYSAEKIINMIRPYLESRWAEITKESGLKAPSFSYGDERH